MALDDEKKRSRFPGLKEGQELTTTSPASKAVSKVLEGVSGIPGAITGGEPVKAYRGYGLGKERGMGFMEAGIPIPEDQSGVRQPIPARPVGMGDIPATTPDVVDLTSPAGGAIPTGPVDLMPRFREIEAGVEGALPTAFDTEKAHKLATERYQEGQVYLGPRQKSIYGDAIDNVLGPAPPVGDDAKFADLMSRATRPKSGQPGAIPSEITPPTSSGNAMVDLFRWVSHNKRIQGRNKLIEAEKERSLATEKFDVEQGFKEKKLASEETGRKSALDLSRRKAIATEATKADKLDPFMTKAGDIVRATEAYEFEDDPEKKQTMILAEAKRLEERHKREKPKFTEGDTREIDGVNYKVINKQVYKF